MSHKSLSSGHGHDAPHVVSLTLLVSVFVALLVLTYLTVEMAVDAWWHSLLGSWAFTAAMALATLKAVLVSLFFMHLFWDRPFHTVIFLGSVFFVGLLIIITMMDTGVYYDRYVQPLMISEMKSTQ